MSAPDQTDRDRARLRLDANAVVEAGAGTGKTTLLTDRLLFRVLGWDEPRPATIEEVVALTFTEKAAGEIKVRLSDRLAEIAAFLALTPQPAPAEERARRTVEELGEHFHKRPPELLRRARAALEDLDKAQIGTIHSFCAHVLRLYPVEAGVDPGFVVDEGDAFDECFASEWAAWLDEELGERPPRRELWRALLARTGLDELETLARELCGEKLELEGLGGPDPVTARELRALAEDLKRRTHGRGKARGNAEAAVTAAYARLTALADAAESKAPAFSAEPPPAVPNASWPKAWGDDPEAQAVFERALEVADSATPDDDALVRLATAALLPFARRTRRAYARRGFISFDGLLRRARDLVRDRPEVRERLKRRYTTLLIDEFQDTDPLQGELLLYLAEKPGGRAKDWREAVPEPGRLFVVGDPKQSIYRFRGADVAAYEGFTGRLLEHGALACDLTANFRCRPSLVEPVNRVFEAVMRPVPGAQPAYKAIRPARPAGEAAGVEVAAVVDGGDGLDAASAARTEAAWAARWVVEGRGALPLSAVAVLLRSSTALPHLLEAFKRSGIPYAVDMDSRFYGAQEVVDFLNLLRALDDPSDRVALAGLLRSPLGGMTDDDLLALSRAGALDYRREPAPKVLPGPARERLARLWSSLRGLRERVGRAPLGELVGDALAETFLVELCAEAYHGQQTVSNLLKLRRLAVEASDRRGATLKAFIARAALAAAESRREGESPLADERLEAVRVMSVHKSKGLEFPAVLLLGLSGRAGGASAEKPASRADWATGRRALRLGGARSAAMALLDAREKALEAHEATRLLYVAMTRARERLILVGREKTERSALSARLLEAGAWPEGGAPGALPAVFVPGGSVPEVVLPRPARAAPPSAPPPAPAPAADPGPWTLAAADAVAAPKRLVLPEDRPASGGAELGRLCHRVLQDWDFAAGGDLDAALARARRGLERRAPGPAWAAASGEAKRVLSAFLASGAARDLAKAEILARELPLAHARDGAVARGAADLVLREKGRLVVVDFKSEAVKDAAAAAAARARHAAQGRAYCAALKAAWGQEAEFRVLFLRRPEL
ncbi:MAG: UvrD-helicase domain-containing protein [Elusimicrobiota bacterium]|nr:UvrD-helicase domain-containing protein [Elusimicrobiota bacterium]